MRIINVSAGFGTNKTTKSKKSDAHSYVGLNATKPDSFSFRGVNTNNLIKFSKSEKTINVVTFTGLNDPTPVAIQFKVRGVTKFQDDYEQVLELANGGPQSEPEMPRRSKAGKKHSKHKNANEYQKASSKHKSEKPVAASLIDPQDLSALNGVSTKSINKLAESDWKDGKELKFQYDPTSKRTAIVDPDFGKIGFVPDEIESKLLGLGMEYSSPSSRANNFRIELSNMIAGTTKGAKTTGLRVNLIYTGKDRELKNKVEKSFNEILNDKECTDMVFLHQPKANPDEVLEKIFADNAINDNEIASKEAKLAIKNIVDVIDDPENKNILLIGHCKPDGDTLGCILGMKNAIDFKYTDKNVDCAVDDKIPGLFRNKLPGVDNVVKRPYSKNKIARMNQAIAELGKEGTQSAKDKIEILEDEKASLQNPQNLINPNKKYDVVVLMDVPTPKRFTDEFKNQIEGAKKVIYIDHHPHRFNEWQDAKEETGVDMEKIHNNHLAWIADAVPAATQQVAVIANKLIPNLQNIKYKDLSQEKQERLDAFVASTVVGMSTDTGAFTRTANLLPKHMKLPAQQRPNFMPEGMSKWLMGLSDKVNKKWLREEITYDIPDTKVPELDKTSRDQMVEYAEAGKKVFEDTSLGIIEVDYNQMFNVWQNARKADKMENKKDLTEFLDIQNAFKYSETMGLLKSDPSKRPPSEGDYKGDFDEDRIAILICQDKKEGELDEKFNIAKQNGLRISLRSSGCTDHAELIANLFDGGGHGGASGGRVDLPGIELSSKLGVVINGKKEKNPGIIYDTLRHNVDVRNNIELSDEEKATQTDKIQLIMDESGKTCTDLIKEVSMEIRSRNPKEEEVEVASNKKHVHEKHEKHGKHSKHDKHGKHEKGKTHFRGLMEKVS